MGLHEAERAYLTTADGARKPVLSTDVDLTKENQWNLQPSRVKLDKLNV